VDQNKFFPKLKEILISNMNIIKEMILTLCYKLALKAFHFFYFSRRYAVPHSCGTLIVCLTGLQYEIKKVSKVEKSKL